MKVVSICLPGYTVYAKVLSLPVTQRNSIIELVTLSVGFVAFRQGSVPLLVINQKTMKKIRELTVFEHMMPKI
jgi:hypothetical protein